jgi:hypothetical protein
MLHAYVRFQLPGASDSGTCHIPAIGHRLLYIYMAARQSQSQKANKAKAKSKKTTGNWKSKTQNTATI